MWLAMTLRTDRAVISLPMPRPGAAVSFAITVRSRFFLPHDLVDQPLRRTHRHEAANHDACAVRDHGNCLIERDGSHG